ncbi:protein kinase [Candidatus Uabimicrobium sp. HlEnr_7]|uniref:protein kinase domain-containing protein n=1 Tax=Candidatus Uabimicrobium helgolandensis TaxID=3095367 RepID=UPI0035593497
MLLQKTETSMSSKKNPLQIELHNKEEKYFLSDQEFISKYKLLEKIGQGGMGVVYKALDLELNRVVALKFISTSQQDKFPRHRFYREVKSLAKLNHPNIVRILSVEEHPQLYFSMEYIAGKTIDQWQHLNDYHKIAMIFSQIAKAVHAFHQQQIIHRDIKPANILISDDKPVIVDFGLAKCGDNYSVSDHIVGTIAFMSPEQVNSKKLDYRTDIYSLGSTLYYILTKRSLFQGENILTQICFEEPLELTKLDSNIPKEIAAICSKCIEKNPSARYKTALELAEDLENFYHNRPIKASPPTAFLRMKKLLMRNKVLSLFLCSLCLFLTFYINSIRQQQKNSIVAKEKIQNQLEKANVHLAEIALAKAKKARQQDEVDDSAVLVGSALDFVKDFNGANAKRIYAQAHAQIKHSLQAQRILWHKYQNDYPDLTLITYQKNTNKLIGVNAKKKTLEVWNLTTGNFYKTIGKNINVVKIEFNLNHLIVTDDSGSIHIWNENYQLQRVISTGLKIKDLLIHPDGNLAILAEKNIHFLSFSGQKLRKMKVSNAAHFAIHPSGKYLVTVNNKEITIWNNDGERVFFHSHKADTLYGLNFSPDGNAISLSSFFELRVWRFSPSSLEKQLTVPASTEELTSRLSSQNRAIFISNKKIIFLDGPRLKVLDVTTGKTTYTFPEIFQNFSNIIATENKIIMSAKGIYSWNKTSQKKLSPNILSSVEYCVYSPNGQTLATLDNSGNIFIYHSQSGALIKSLHGCSRISKGISFLSNTEISFVSNNLELCVYNITKNTLDKTKNTDTSVEILATDSYLNMGKKIQLLYKDHDLDSKVILFDKNGASQKIPLKDTSGYYTFLFADQHIIKARKRQIDIWNTDNFQKTTIHCDQNIERLFFRYNNIVATTEKSIQVWNIKTAKLINKINFKAQNILIDNNTFLWIKTSKSIVGWNFKTMATKFLCHGVGKDNLLAKHPKKLQFVFQSLQKNRLEIRDLSSTYTKNYDKNISNIYQNEKYRAIHYTPTYSSIQYSGENETKQEAKIIEELGFAEDIKSSEVIQEEQITLNEDMYLEMRDSNSGQKLWERNGIIKLFHLGTQKSLVRSLDAFLILENATGKIFKKISPKILQEEGILDTKWANHGPDVMIPTGYEYTISKDMSLIANQKGNKIYVRSFVDYKIVSEISPKHHEVFGSSLHIGPNNKHLLVLTNDVELYDIITGKRLLHLPNFRVILSSSSNTKTAQLLHHSFSDDGNFLALSNSENTQIWNLKNQKQCVSITQSINDLTIHPNNKLLITSDSKRISLWNLTTGRFLQNILYKKEMNGIDSLSCSTDQQTLYFSFYHNQYLGILDISYLNDSNFSNPTRRDISQQKMGTYLRKNPRQITEYLFGRKVNRVLEVENITNKKNLWTTSIDLNK